MPTRFVIVSPRMLRVADAAAYVGLSVTVFREMVLESVIPPPIKRRTIVAWDVRELDAYIDSLPREGDLPESTEWTNVAL